MVSSNVIFIFFIQGDVRVARKYYIGIRRKDEVL